MDFFLGGGAGISEQLIKNTLIVYIFLKWNEHIKQKKQLDAVLIHSLPAYIQTPEDLFVESGHNMIFSHVSIA